MVENTRTIIHIITTIDRGGAEKHLLTLVRQQVLQGNKVVVVSFKGNDELGGDFLDAGAQIYPQNRTGIRLLKLLANSSLAKNSIVHAHLPRAELLTYIALRCLNSKIKFVISRHNSERFFPSAKTRVCTWISSSISRLVTRRASAVIAISNSVRNFMISQDEVYCKTPIYVVHYGVNTDFKDAFKNSKEMFRVGTIARLVNQKNLHFLLNAIFVLDKQDLEFKIVGKGPLEFELRQKIEELGIEQKVEILGPMENIEDFYGSIDLFVLPSFYEGFGLVVLEAMVHRVPVLASKIPTMQEILGDDYPGLFDLKSVTTLVRLLEQCNSLGFRKDLEKRQNLRLSSFNVQNMLIKTEKVYLYALNSK